MTKIREMSREEALNFLDRAPAMQVAGCDEAGVPVLRTLHGVVLDGAVVFHGSKRGEKSGLVGRPVVVSAEETVARIPSWMRDPERACPATTFYRGVQVRGPLEEVEDIGEKAKILQAFMLRFQPEGRHVPITPDSPLYEAPLRGLRVLRVRPAEIISRVKLGTHLGPQERRGVLRGLWERGGPGDLPAIEAILAGNPGEPHLFEAPDGLTPCVAPGPADARAAAELLLDAYWNAGQTPQQLAQAHLNSPAWVVLRGPDGALRATARAIGDGTKRAWVYDVCVAPGQRGRGIGQALMAILLDHPAIRGAEINLGTRDAQRFYAPMGFVPVSSLPPKPYTSTWMVRPRR